MAAEVYSTNTSFQSDSNYDLVSVRLLYGESHGISWTDLAQESRLPPVLSHKYMDVLGLDYHYQSHYLFFSGLGNIWRLLINETAAAGLPEVMVEGADGPSSVAVDWVQDRVYWTSPGTRTVQRADLAGSRRTIVLGHTGNLSLHNNLVLDPYHRLLFLAVDGASIIRSDLDGGDVEYVGIGDSDYTRMTLAVDIHRRRLYVSVRKDYVPHLLACEYDGSGALKYDLADKWWNSFPSIGVYRDQLYWAHHGWRERDTVWKANMTANGSVSWMKEYTAGGTVLDPENNIWVLKVYHPEIQTPNVAGDVAELGPPAPVHASCPQWRGSSRLLHFIVFCANIWVNSNLKR